jgi:hypothetical protein
MAQNTTSLLRVLLLSDINYNFEMNSKGLFRFYYTSS